MHAQPREQRTILCLQSTIPPPNGTDLTALTIPFFSEAEEEDSPGTEVSAAAMFSDNTVVSDIIATGLSGGIALSLLKTWEQTAKRGVFDQVIPHDQELFILGDILLLIELLVICHSSGRQGAILAALIPDLETIGMADIVGTRFGSQKLAYNQKKSVVGSITMACAGFLASIGYMLYFSSFGYIKESSKMVLGLLIVSVAAALVESHPLSTKLDDNLTVSLAAVLVGSLVL
ncbi:hypothetical protein Pfo_026731 [Paulownia fortunei]|nr:hypothetical protein Pfo_026731 [Paulownia fortunei]